MALIQCYECLKEISDKAPACPHGGAPTGLDDIVDLTGTGVSCTNVAVLVAKK